MSAQSGDNCNDSVSAQFQAVASEIDTIFFSFRQLYEVYTTSIGGIHKSLNKLPQSYRKQIENQKKALESVAKTVDIKQREISNHLHAQGLVLLVGGSESLTREMFRTLLRQNIRKIKLKKSPLLPLKDVLSANTDEELGDLVLSALENDKNPSEKLNFQNMQSVKGIMQAYLEMNVEDDIAQGLHKYWQIRHVIIHNASIVNKKFIENLKAADLPVTGYKEGQLVDVTKKDYDDCFSLLVLLFDNFDEQIEKLKLKYEVE